MSDQEGPDRIFPCENLTTSEKDGCVKIRKTKDWPANRDTMSLPTFFRKQCESAADQKALSVKRDGKWVNWTYKQYYDDVITVSKAFITLGLERYNSVCIYGFNCPEWFFSYLAAIHAGGKVKNSKCYIFLSNFYIAYIFRPLVCIRQIVPRPTSSS